MDCPKCYAPLEPGKKFCGKCGAQAISGSAAKTATTSIAQPSVAPSHHTTHRQTQTTLDKQTLLHTAGIGAIQLGLPVAMLFAFGASLNTHYDGVVANFDFGLLWGCIVGSVIAVARAVRHKVSFGGTKAWPVSLIVAVIALVATYIGWNVTKQARLNNELLEAAEVGPVAEVSSLLSRGANPNYESAGFTPLCYAVSISSPDVARGEIEALISAGADVNSTDGLYTPLGKAAWLSDLNGTAILQLLVSHGAGVNTCDKYGKSPLSLCSDDACKAYLTSVGAH